VNQTMRQRRTLMDCKVAIGSKYTGPSLDRPALRYMPRDWKLDTNDKPRQWLPDPGTCVAVTVVLAWLFAIAVSLNWILL